jgi:hypothetical protein
MLDARQVAEEEVAVAIAALRIAAGLGHPAARHGLKILLAEAPDATQGTWEQAFEEFDRGPGRREIDDSVAMARVRRIGGCKAIRIVATSLAPTASRKELEAICRRYRRKRAQLERISDT